MPENVLRFGIVLRDVARRRHVFLGGHGGGAEHVLVAALLEDAVGGAVEQHGEFLHLLGHRRHRQAVAGGDHSDHQVHVLALDQVAVFGDDLGRATGFIDVHHLDRASAETFLFKARNLPALVERVDHQIRRILGRNSEGARSRSGKEGDHADSQRSLRRGERTAKKRECEKCGSRADAAQEAIHD